MSLDIQMVASEFLANNMKTWIHPVMDHQFKLVLVV